MEAQLKGLKVPELKAILQKAGLTVTGKKDELIARIIASPAASASLSPHAVAPVAAPAPTAPAPAVDDDLLAPPEEFDWGTGAPTTGASTATDKAAVAAPATKPASTKTPSDPTAPLATGSTTTSSTPAVAADPIVPPESAAKAVTEDDDEELAKRKARAARFGIPLVEPKQKAAPVPAPASGPAARAGKKGKRGAAPTASLNPEVEVKKAARAERFGLKAADVKPAPVLDPAEEEKKRKRAERFGISKPVEEPETKKTKTS